MMRGTVIFRITWLVILSLSCIQCVQRSEPFIVRSILELKKLASRDLQTVYHIQQFKTEYPVSVNFRKLIDAYIADLQDSVGEKVISDLDVDDIVHNPIVVYRLIRRSLYFWKELAKEFQALPENLRRPDIFELPIKERIHSEVLEDAAEVLFRIQQVYGINSSGLAAGDIVGTKTNARLRGIHCYEIGNYAKIEGKYTMAIDWFNSALKFTKTDHTVDVGLIVSALSETYEMHDVDHESKSRSNLYCYVQPIVQNGTVNLDIPTSGDRYYQVLAGKREHPNHWLATYWGLCSGKLHITEAVRAHLFCWLEKRINKWYTIGPLKMEFLHRSPDVVQVYEAITEDDVKDVTKLAKENDIAPSTVLGGQLSPSSRSSSHVFIGDETRKSVATIKAGRISGLNTILPYSCEYLQVANYAVGGHYAPHSDSLLTPAEYGESQGDRVATVMYYISDVKQGGSTVFINAMATAYPSKRSAVMWFNTFSDGTRDPATEHGACPVIMGEKWVANEWIRYNDQIWGHKCGLEPKERFRFAVNGQYPPIPEVLRNSHVDEEEDFVVPSAKYSYGSIPELHALAKLEWKIYSRLSALLKGEVKNMKSLLQFKNNTTWLTKYLADYGESAYTFLQRSVGNDRLKKLVWSPIRAYRMIWRFENYVKMWLEDSSKNKGWLFTRVTKYIRQVYSPKNGPTTDDLNEAMSAILQTQQVNDFKAIDIARGKLGNSEAGVRLQAVHCTQLGRHASSIGYYHLAVDWYETAVLKVDHEGDSSVKPSDAKLLVAEAHREHDARQQLSEGWEPDFFLHPISQVSDPNLRKLRKQASYDTYKFGQGSNLATINYWGLCQGLPHQFPNETKNLFCWYEREIHPSWKIGPLKAEILSMHPHMEIVRFHDILTPRVIENLTNEQSKEFVKASVGSHDVQQRKIDVVARLSTVLWLSEKKFELVLNISKLIERAVGLRVVGTVQDDLQLAGYTAGSHYTTHPDALDRDIGTSRARIATFMFYLSDVEEGGETVFSQAGARAKPQKGSAVFWYNLFSSGDIDPFTWHGACPVIYGEKWVANQWIHLGLQKHLKCGLSPASRHEILVNGKSKYP